MSDTPLPRDAFPVVDGWVYLNHAGVSPLPAPAVDAMAAYAARAASDGGEAWRENETLEADVRARAGRLMGVDGADVAFVPNTSAGLALVVNGLEWAEGDRVVVPACEFPSNLYPWLALTHRGVEVVRVEPAGPGERLPVEAFERVLSGGARVLALSWAQFGRGWRSDLAAIGALCRDHGVLFVVDAIQGVGLMPAAFAEWGVGVAAADGYKWMLGPEGAGVAYVSPAAREQLRVSAPGWNSVSHRADFDRRDPVLDPTARRYEPGTLNDAGLHGLGASLALLETAGVDAIWAHVDRLCLALIEGLEAAGAEVLTDRRDGGGSGIVTFRHPGMEPDRLADELVTRRFSVRARGGGVRAAPHGYNTFDEIEAFAAAVGEVTGATSA